MRPFASGLITAVAIIAATRVIGAGLPAEVTHTLNAGCRWEPRRWTVAARIETFQPSARADAARYACMARRGLKSPSPVVYRIVERWPSEEETTHARALPARDHPADLRRRLP